MFEHELLAGFPEESVSKNALAYTIIGNFHPRPVKRNYNLFEITITGFPHIFDEFSGDFCSTFVVHFFAVGVAAESVLKKGPAFVGWCKRPKEACASLTKAANF